MSQRRTTGDRSRMSERLGEWLIPLCSHQLAQVAEHASSVVKMVINLESAQLEEAVEAAAQEEAELASNVEKKAISQENAQLAVVVVAAEAVELASNVEKMVISQESALTLVLLEDLAQSQEVP
jgi:SMC interacting uncharacterized protein involved in chromosome segregation